MIEEKEEYPSANTSPLCHGDVSVLTEYQSNRRGLFHFVKTVFKSKQDASLRETIEEYIEDDSEDAEETSISFHEKTLISNVLDLRDMSASDVMVPRADIVAINHSTTQVELFSLLSERQYSRLPVYRDTLDNVIGTIHVKDVMATLARGEAVDLASLIRDIPIVSPSMQILDLLLQMRVTRKHMALVVDEFGGIDGLITIGDVIESIVGEIDDEHDPEDQLEIVLETDGTIIANARVDIVEFERQFGTILTEDERSENDTLGGLVFSIAGRVPARGEILTHKSGMIFEVLEADPRRVKRLLIRNAPEKS